MSVQALHDSRHVARMMALQALCQFDVQGIAFSSQLRAFLNGLDDECLPLAPESVRQRAAAAAEALASETWREREELDRRIGRVSSEWRIERMSCVDRNILRLGLFELLHRAEVPFRAVINEAVELARAFGDNDSAAFVNGVLDAAWRAIEAETEMKNVVVSEIGDTNGG